MTGFGKYDDNGPVIRLSENADPRKVLADRIRTLGGNEAIVDAAMDTYGRGRADLTRFTDEQLSAQIEAILAGSPDGFAPADAAAIEQAREDPDLYMKAAAAVQTSVPRVIAWVGTDAGRAVVAHEAELQRVKDEGGEPRVTLIRFCQAIHGSSTVGA